MTLSSVSITVDTRRELRLRVGIVLGGALVEERLVGQDLVTIGQSAQNTFSLPVEGAPRAWPLFRRVRGQFLLGFSDDMDGRLSNGDGVATFAELRRGRASRARGGWTVPIGKGARGKIALDGATILFQVLEVPVRPRPTLPKSIRGGISERINPMLTAIVAVSLAVHGAFAYWLYQRDLPARTVLQQIGELTDAPADEPARAIVVPAEILDRLEPFDTPRPGVDVPATGDPATPRHRPRGDRSSLRRDGGDRGALDDARIRELVDDTAAISVLTGGPDGSSRYARMTGKDPGGDLDRALEHLGSSGAPIVTQRPDGLQARDGGHRDIVSSDAPVLDGPRGDGRADDKAEVKVPAPRIEEVDPLDPDGVDPEEIASIIRRRYLKGIKRCHSDLLVRDASAGGRVDIEFTVNRVGKVIRARVRGFDAGLEQCVEGLAMRWRFPVAKADDTPIEASYATTFLLKAP